MNTYSKRLRTMSMGAIFTLACFIQTTQAHFIWIVPEKSDDGRVVQAYFGEDASPDDPDLLKLLKGMKVWSLTKGEEPKSLEMARSGDGLFAKLGKGTSDNSILVATHDYGVMSRGETSFFLKYYAKSGPQLGNPAWKKIDASKQLRLNVIPEKSKTGVLIHVLFDGNAVAGSEVKASGPGLEDFVATTGESGTVEIPLTKSGLYSIRAKHVEAKSGTHDEKEYSESRHYSTLALGVQSDASQAADVTLQPLEQPVTSFGGAIVGKNLFIYGGHTGGAHSYSKKEQGNSLKRLSLKTGKWKTLAEGPHLQGLALVTHGRKLYRIGGFTAKNAEGEDHDLWSQNTVVAFDLKSKKWSDMPSLPEPRSSFDAAVLDGTIYVLGGWQMSGAGDKVWHDHGYKMDLNAETPKWEALPKQPFHRRAVSVAAHNGKLFVIGGMQEEGGPTTKVAVFDPKSNTWSESGSLVIAEKPKTDSDEKAERGGFSGGMTGFGTSAFATGGRLYVSTINGELQRLNKDGSKWEIIRQTPTPRFFHRLLPVNDSQLLVVGGASMQIGKFDEIEILNVGK